MTSCITFRAPQQCINSSSRHGQKMGATPTVLSVDAAREFFRAVRPEPTSSFSGSSAECRTRLLWPWQPPSPELLNRDDLQDSKTSWQSSQSLWVSSSFLENPKRLRSVQTSGSSSAERRRFGNDSGDSTFSQLSSTTKLSVSLRRSARSTTFCNSRMFPGQW